MQLIPLKSRLVRSGDDLVEAIGEALKRNKQCLKEGDVLLIASKTVAYSQGLLRKSGDLKSLRAEVLKEADQVLDDGDLVITLKNKILIPNAGIDKSNTPEGWIVLWPEKPFDAARQLHRDLSKRHGVRKWGVCITDSHCQPLRAGTAGLALAWHGFEGVRDERGKKDLFKKKMVHTQIAVADNLASAATLLMGETDASIPFVIARGAPVRWTKKQYSADDYWIDPKHCIFKSFYPRSLKS